MNNETFFARIQKTIGGFQTGSLGLNFGGIWVKRKGKYGFESSYVKFLTPSGYFIGHNEQEGEHLIKPGDIKEGDRERLCDWACIAKA